MQKKTEKIAGFVISTFGCIAVASVIAITLFLFAKGMPGLIEAGPLEVLFTTAWEPGADSPSYGILYCILSSVAGTAGAILIGVPVGILTAVFLTEYTSASKTGRTLSKGLSSAVELLAAIPSVIYGLVGMMILNPMIYDLERMIFQDDPTHQFTGGSNLLSAIIVLAVMILPTVINISASSIRAVPGSLSAASLALGASKMQTIFKVVLPAAKSGIMAGVVLGINMVAGGVVNLPLPFNSVKVLTTLLVSEMAYSEDLHRRVLFTVGLVLYVFIVAINLVLTKMKKEK